MPLRLTLSAHARCVGWKDARFAGDRSAAIEALAQWLADGGSAPHGGESIRQVCLRTERWMDSLRGDGHLVAVTHPLILRAALMRVLHCPPSAFHALDVMPLAAIDLRFNGMWRLRCGGLDALS